MSSSRKPLLPPELAQMPVMTVVMARGRGDCAIACLAMLLNKSYEDVLAMAVKHTRSSKTHHNGLWTGQMVSIAKDLGVVLKRKRKWDLAKSTGILGLCNTRTHEGHVVVLHSGLLIDVDGSLWNPTIFFAATKYRATVLLCE